MASPGDASRQGPMVHKADPSRRREMLAWLVATAIFGVLLLVGLKYWLGHLEATVGSSDPFAYYRWLSRLLAGIATLFAGGAFALGVWVHRLATAALRDRRWPPLGYRSSSDLKIRYLTSADAFIGNLRIASYASFALSAALVLWAAWLAVSA